MAQATPDYRKTLFETSTLPVIADEPNFEIIRKWHNMLKANAMKVHTSLFGGKHGYLALLISPEDYALVSTAEVVRPAYPEPLVIPINTTQHMVMTMKDTHKEAIRLFREINAVEAALQQMLVEAIDPIYIEAIRDRATNSINLPIFDVIQYLYDTYGDIRPEILEQERETLIKSTYNPNLPIDVLFSKIEKFTDLASAGRSPISQKQSVDFAYNIFRKTGIFTRYLLEWDAKPILNQTWIQMRVDFRQAVKELRKTGALQVNSLHANLVQEIVSGVQEAIQQDFHSSSPFPLTTIPESVPSILQTDESTLDSTIVNAMATDTTIQTIQAQLQQLTLAVQNMTTTQASKRIPFRENFGGRGRGRGRSKGRGRGRGRGRGGWIQQQNPFNQQPTTSNPFQQLQQQQFVPQYCWTHGACGHTSEVCRAPLANHCWEATFENRMNGNPNVT